MSRASLLLMVIVGCVSGESDFTYTGRMGPEHWSEHYDQCAGKHQSPININDLNVVKRSYPPLDYEGFAERPTDGCLLNNGHTVLVKLQYADGRPTITSGPLADKGIFRFEQLHFHWGEDNSRGSEDLINDISFPAELHMVFSNTKYGSFSEAVTRSDGVSVLAFFYQIHEEPNPNYIEFTELLENIHDPHHNTSFRHPPTLNDLIMDDLENFYTYTGSLTTPPCSEDVTWIDFATPIKISSDQIDRFRRLKTNDGSPLTRNFRPIQPLNDRTVYKAIHPHHHHHHHPSRFENETVPTTTPFADARDVHVNTASAVMSPFTLFVGIIALHAVRLVP